MRGGVTVLDHTGTVVAKAFLGEKLISCEWIGNEELVVTTDSWSKVSIVNPWSDEIRFEAEIEPRARSPLKQGGPNLRIYGESQQHFRAINVGWRSVLLVDLLGSTK
jgi:hypothetical protein